MAALAGFGRVAYSELLTLVALSVLSVALAATVILAGAAVLSLVAVVTRSIETERTGERLSERGRIRLFLDEVRGNIRRGIPMSLLLFAVVAVTLGYLSGAATTRDPVLLLGSLVGLYAIVIVIVGSLRAATLLTRAPADTQRSTVTALRNAGYHLLEHPWFTVLHLVFAGFLVFLCLWTQIGVLLVLPGLLAVLEVVAFEETSGDGALQLVRAYRGDGP